MARIDLDNLGLSFWVTAQGAMSSWERIRYLCSGKRPRSVVRVAALEQISLNLRDGDRIGIIGHNGAGKSTLLKVIADIYPPTEGARRVVGRVSSLFDFALGFELDATGWENIAYRGYLLGDTREAVRQKREFVAEFSELGDALNLPVRYYSAGMRVRLAFGIATSVDPDILLIDEAFNAGDLPFRAKARQRLHQLMTQARIVVTVSHELDLLAELCDQVIWMDHGRIVAMGPTREMLRDYQKSAGACQAA